MASITIRNLEDDLKRRLRVRAAEHGRSASIRARMAPLGGVELELPAREAMREPPRFAGKRA